MSEVTILVTGLSLCKPQVSANRGLEVLFIHPMKLELDLHLLTVKIRKKSKAPSNLTNEEISIDISGKTKIEILLENTDSIESNNPASFNDVVNFDSFYDRDLTLYNNPYVECSYLTIPNARPFTAVYDEIYLYSPNKYHNGRKTRIDPARRRVAKKLATKFRINGGTSLGKIRLVFAGAVTREEVLEFNAEMDYEIEFDNRDQVENVNRDDFQLYYEVLLGHNRDGKKFTILFERAATRTVPVDPPADQQACNTSKGGGGCDFLRFFENGTCQ